MTTFVVRSDRLAGFPAGTVIQESDLPKDTILNALLDGMHIEVFDEGTVE